MAKMRDLVFVAAFTIFVWSCSGTISNGNSTETSISVENRAVATAAAAFISDRRPGFNGSDFALEVRDTLARGRKKFNHRNQKSRGKRRNRRSPFKQMAISKYLVVDQSGSGTFRTIQSAVDSIPIGNTQWIYVQINAGTYKEKVIIPQHKPYIIFQGAGRDKTIIDWNDIAAKSGGTAYSATFSAWSPSFIAKGITFKNSAPAPPPGASDRQAVAVLAAEDQQAFYSCGFYGAQDTLFDYGGRHYYRNCYIEGSIDVIFGHAQSIFRDCELHSIAETYGSLAAHNRMNPQDGTGFLFWHCTITGTGQVFLGRAWGPYPRIVYIDTTMANNVMPEGWYDWGVSQRESTSYFGEYDCHGPGANRAGRVSWSHELTEDEARPLTKLSFINAAEWLTET